MTSAGSKAIRDVLPSGYTLVAGSKHHSVHGPDGEPVRHDDGRKVVVPKGGRPNTHALGLIVKSVGAAIERSRS